MRFHESLHNGLLDPELVVYYDEVCHTVRGYVHSQNNTYRGTEGPHAVDEVRLHDLKFETWRAVSVVRTAGPCLFIKQSIPKVLRE
jgi:hypothetical protein